MASSIPTPGRCPEVFFFLFNLEKQKLCIRFPFTLTLLIPESKFADRAVLWLVKTHPFPGHCPASQQGPLCRVLTTKQLWLLWKCLRGAYKVPSQASVGWVLSKQ